MILCTPSMLKLSEQSMKCRSCSENMKNDSSFYTQNNKIAWLSNITDTFFWEIHEVRKGLWAFFLDGVCQMLIDWAGKFQSRGLYWYKRNVISLKRLCLPQVLLRLITTSTQTRNTRWSGWEFTLKKLLEWKVSYCMEKNKHNTVNSV